jgi:hypothetical protein
MDQNVSTNLPVVCGISPYAAFCLFLFISLTVQSNGQQRMPESQNMTAPIFDTVFIDRLIDRSSLNIDSSRKDSAVYYADKSLAESDKMNYMHGMAMAYLMKSRIAKQFDNDDTLSEQNSKESLRYYEKTSNRKGIINLYFYLWYANFSRSKFDEATDWGGKAYAEAIKTNDQNGIFVSLTNMFEIYRQTGNYEKGFEFAEQLYDISIKSENKSWIRSSLRNLAELYTLIEEYPVALNYYRRIRNLKDQDLIMSPLKNEGEFRLDMEFAELFGLMNQFDSAWHYYAAGKPSDTSYNSYYLLSTGECLFRQGNFQQALQNFNLSLSGLRQRNQSNEITRAILDIAKVNLTLDNSTMAIKYGQEGLAISVKSQDYQFARDGYKILSDVYGLLGKTDSSNYYFRKYSIIKDVILNDLAKGKIAAYSYKQRIVLLKKEEEIQGIRLQRETFMKNILFGSIIILSLFAFTFSRNIILKRRSEARLRELAENELHIQKLESAKSRAELLHQRAELEMKALRAQMNPHFIFNCLNSINRFIIGNDAERAAGYLTKFAKLIRIVLEKSGKPFIPLAEELDCLKLYMDLEALRFENPFLYEINCNGINGEMVMVPSLLIQPFVENAIWHGLHPGSNIHGKIKIDMNLEKDILHCQITDNGIGMAGSAALKGNNGDFKKSLGIELTKNRLRLADSLHHEKLGVSIQDLKDEAGQNLGTCIHIKIPIREI